MGFPMAILVGSKTPPLLDHPHSILSNLAARKMHKAAFLLIIAETVLSYHPEKKLQA